MSNMLLVFMGVVMVGLIGLIVILLGQRAGGSPTTTTNNPASGGSIAGVPTVPPANGAATGSTPPRMPLAEFKTLYDNPATRPMIIDVRAVDAYNQGHIAGAISMPETEVDAAYVKLPKDKLIIAYCQ